MPYVVCATVLGLKHTARFCALSTFALMMGSIFHFRYLPTSVLYLFTEEHIYMYMSTFCKYVECIYLSVRAKIIETGDSFSK